MTDTGTLLYNSHTVFLKFCDISSVVQFKLACVIYVWDFEKLCHEM